MLAFFALLVALLAGWAALVNAGRRRIVATVLALLALVGLVVALLQEVIAAGPRWSSCCWLVSAVAARFALGRTSHSSTADAATVGPAQRGVLLMNPKSGGGKVDEFNLVDEASDAACSRSC